MKDDYKIFFKYIEDESKESKDISHELFKKHFQFEEPTVLVKKNYMRQKIKGKIMT